jgi:hypothetical protein
MKPFEFVLVIISVIVGLALTEFAIGVSYMIQNFRTAHFYWPHITVMLFGLVSCLNYWGTVYKLRKIDAWSIMHIGLVFLSGLIFFIMTKLYFPDPDKFDLDYERYFKDNIKITFALMICFVISFMLEAIVIRKVRQLRKFTIMIVFILAISSGLLIDNHLYVGILTVILLLMQIAYMVRTKTLIADREN